MILVNTSLFIVIGIVCWRGYRDRQPWLLLTSHLLSRLYQGRGFWRQLFVLGPMIVGWLLLCHWLDHRGAHGLAAGGIMLAMTLAVDALRSVEERQKQAREE